MAFSGGVFSRLYDWTTDRDNGVKILASRMDQEFDGMATGLSTCILKDGTQTCTAAVPFAEGLTIPDDKTLVFGTDSDVTIQYDEATNNALEIAANVEGAALGVVLKADQGDDNADQWKVNVADGGTLSINSKISGSFVSQLTLTPNATAASSTTAIAGNITVGGTVDGRDLATDGSKLDGIEASADVTDTANVTAAGALMDSEVTNLAQVKSFDSADYATAAQGSTADSALQNVSEDTTPQLGGNLDLNSNNITGTGNIDVTGTVTADGLTVEGDAAVSSATPRIRLFETDTTDLNTQLQNNGGEFVLKTLLDDASNSTTRIKVAHSTGDISFYADDGTTQGLFWDASTQRLGLGTTSPAAKLHSYSNSAVSVLADGAQTFVGVGLRNLQDNAGGTTTSYVDAITNNGGTVYYDASMHIQHASDKSSSISFLTQAAGAASDRRAERMRITSDGVGIGLTSMLYNTAATQLSVGNTSGQGGMNIVSGTGSLGVIRFADGTAGSDPYRGRIEYDHSGDHLMFGTSGIERMRIKNDGEINIGGGSDSFTEAHLNVYNNGGTSNGWGGAALTVYGPYGGGISFVDSGTNPADSDNGYKMHTVDGGNDFYIRGSTSKNGSSGGVYLNNFATSWSSASDERQKENIVNITGALNDVATLRAVKANYIWSDTTRAFLIAQDVQAVLPEAVSIQNKEAEEAEQRLGIDYYQVVPLLVAALKEAKTKIETLETEMTALKERVTALGGA